MIRTSFVLASAVLFCAMVPARPASAQNLLLNPSFEAGSQDCPPPGASANASRWSGSYAIYFCADPGASDCGAGACGSRTHLPNPKVIDGNQVWEVAAGPGESETVRIWQTVPVNAGETVTLTGAIDVGPGGGIIVTVTNEATVRLWDGLIGDSLLDEELVTPSTPTTNGDWVDVMLSGAPTSGLVTVEIEAFIDVPSNAPAGSAGAVHADNFSLTSDVPCAVQHTLSATDTSTGAQNGDTNGVVLTGTDLDRVTAVKLVQQSTDTVIEGAIQGAPPAGATSITVDFPTNGAPAGLYNVVTEQASCVTQVLEDAFELLDANLLVNLNGDFEAPENAGNVQIWFGNYFVYGCPAGPDSACTNAEGAYGARVHKPFPRIIDGIQAWEISAGGGDQALTASSQTVPVVTGDSVTLTGFIHVGPDPNATNTATVTLYDGIDNNAAVIGAQTVDKTSTPTLGDWVEVSIAGQADSGFVTVEMTAQVIGGGETAAVHADAFRLVPGTPCPDRPVPAPKQFPNPYPRAGITTADAEGIVISGDDLDLVQNVLLIQVDEPNVGTPLDEPETVLAGAITAPSPTSLTVNFPTTGAPTGFYNLQLEREGCPPEVLVDAFEVLPPFENELLFNGDFEAEGPQGNDAAPVAGWLAKDVGVLDGDEPAHAPKYNGSTHVPTGNDATVAGNNRGSIDGRDAGAAFQSRWVLPDVNVVLTGYVRGCITTEPESSLHQVNLRDGGPDGSLLGSYTATTCGGVWENFELQGVPTTDVISVDWGFSETATGWVEAAATHVDELSLVETAVACHDPFADADGDGDVDQTDFAVLQLCYTGAAGSPTIPTVPEYCPCFNRDPDDDIDQSDVVAFTECFTGPDVPFDPQNPGNCTP